jgi:hypothetical protein
MTLKEKYEKWQALRLLFPGTYEYQDGVNIYTAWNRKCSIEFINSGFNFFYLTFTTFTTPACSPALILII